MSTFKMTYDKRNRSALDKLAPNTKYLAYKWYKWCEENKIDILVVETIRTIEQQRKNVAKGVSQTMESFHLVGQALDFVPIIKGKDDWKAYGKKPFINAIEYAEKLGFESGHRWGWDSPHLQYGYKGYGTDKVLTLGKDDKEEKKNDKRIGKVTLTCNHNIYEDATAKSDVVKEVKKGQTFYAYDEKAGFYCVSTDMWVMKKYVRFEQL